MATLSPAQIYALARNAGLSPLSATTATAVALAESGGRTDAMGDVGLEDGTWGPSVGLWQIRSLKAQTGTGQVRDASRLTDPAFNASSMAQISGSGKSFSAWTTFTKGTYKKFLTQAGSAAKTNGDDPTSSGGSWLGGVLAGLGVGFGSTVNPGLEGPLGTAGGDAGNAVSSWASGWGADALKIALFVVGGAAAAGLVIVGAVHTVSEK